MADIIKLMKAMGYPSEDEEGVCRGLSLMAERARRHGYAKFEERMQYLKKLELEEKEDFAEYIKKHPDDEVLKSLHAFFFQVWMHFKPQAIQKFLGTPGPYFPQNEFNKAQDLIQQEEPLPIPSTYLLSLKNSKSALTELDDFFQTMQKASESVGLLIESSSHSIHLFYDKAQKKWKLTNHSTLREYSSINEFLPSLINLFTKNNIANLSFSVFTNGPSSEPVLTKLKQLSDASLESLCKSREINRVDTRGSTFMYVAAQEGHVDVVTTLLEKGASVNHARNDGCTPLYIAAANGHIEVVKALLKNNAVNQATQDGITPLCIAAQNGYVEIVKILLDYGASVSQVYQNTTPLYTAAQNGHAEVVEILLKKDTTFINQTTQDGITPLFIAAQEGYRDVVKLLLANQASVDQPRSGGMTPIFIAILEGHAEVVKTLLEYGASLDQTLLNNYDATPLYVATEIGHLEVMSVLLNKIALIKENEEMVSTLWDTVKTKLPSPVLKNDVLDKLMRYVDATEFSDHGKSKKAFFIEIGLLMASKQLTRETLVDKLEQYAKTDLFHTRIVPSAKSDAAKLVQLLFSKLGHELSDRELKTIVKYQVSTIKNDLLKSNEKTSHIGFFAKTVAKGKEVKTEHKQEITVNALRPRR